MEQLIIIGAGAAGLMAARELSPYYKITILEAGNTPGGRMCTLQDMDGWPIEAGAEFIHGHLPLTLALLKEANLGYYPVEGNMYQVEQGIWTLQEEMIDGWDSLLEEMGKVKEDITLQTFLDQHYPLPQNAAFRDHISGYVQGFDLADPEKVSVKYLFQEWTNESDDNFRIKEGYTALVNFLSRKCNILTGHTVTQVDWQAGSVIVSTDNHKTFKANKLILTVPLPVLQERSISFSPAIDTYQEAADVIGSGSVIKLVLKFRQSLWQEDTGFIFSTEKVPTWWTQLPGKAPLLTGWLGGPPAIEVLDADDSQLLDMAITSLSGILRLSPAYIREQLVDNHIFRWPGAYSYGTPHSEQAQQLLNTPLLDTLYFAGEALYTGKSPGTVEAALNSGKAVANRILSTINV